MTISILKILKQSKIVLNKLPNLSTSDVLIEYQQSLISQYLLADIKATNKAIRFYLTSLTTKCLAYIRYKQEKQSADYGATKCC